MNSAGHRAIRNGRWERLCAVRSVIMPAWIGLGICMAGLAWLVSGDESSAARAEGEFVGSGSCRQCHERFYALWSPSHHGLAMQPYTGAFAREHLTAQQRAVQIGKYSYRADIAGNKGAMVEQGPEGERRYEMVHVMGGKYVYYFLTPYERGRLQTLPLAYDVEHREWFDTAASGVRHFPGRGPGEPVHWTDPLYTFDTACHACHVSQLTSNYDLKTDTYHTEWSEPGINCETCHGPGQRHVRMYEQAEATGEEPNELGLISTRPFSAQQTNSLCNSCHAKLTPITLSFTPGEKYFDHFGLATLEDPDFYPDGRDLGENYTMTLWRMSPCVKSGQLDCTHCHTSSGRYRFVEAVGANGACLPCHQEKVENVVAHSHHEREQEAQRCISCHMPTTQFARMRRTDHSMRPPVPAATLKYQSPNACNVCHKDEDAAWAQEHVVRWKMDTRQAEYLRLADTVDQARRGDWERLGEMLAYIQREDRDEIVATSLVRLLGTCESQRKWPVLIKVLEKDASPLVRAAAVETLDGYLTADSFEPLLRAARDDYRLVRVRAAGVLTPVPQEQIPREYQAQVQRATSELMQSFEAFPDHYVSHYNQGNIYRKRSEFKKAIDAYRTAIRLRPDFAPTYVNIAFAYNATGDNVKAETSFREALVLDPNNPAIHLNLGMLLAELGRPAEAREAFRTALKFAPGLAQAAYNLGVLLASEEPGESLRWCRQAYHSQPDEGKYGYTYAFFLYQQGKIDEATNVLTEMIDRQTPYGDAYALLGRIYLEQSNPAKAAMVYEAAESNESLTPRERQIFGVIRERLN